MKIYIFATFGFQTRMYGVGFLRFTNAEPTDSYFLFQFLLFRPNPAIYLTFDAKFKSYSSFRSAFQSSFQIEAKDDQYQANQWFVNLLSHRYFLQYPDLLSFNHQNYPVLIIFSTSKFALQTPHPFPNLIPNFLNFASFLTLPSLPEFLLKP